MLFHARITFKGSAEGNDKPSMIAIGDTVIVENSEQTVTLTENIPRKYQQISYTLDEEEDEPEYGDDEDKENAGATNNRRSTRDTTVLEGVDMNKRSTRYGANKAKQKNLDVNVKKNQAELIEKKVKEI